MDMSPGGGGMWASLCSARRHLHGPRRHASCGRWPYPLQVAFAVREYDRGGGKWPRPQQQTAVDARKAKHGTAGTNIYGRDGAKVFNRKFRAEWGFDPSTEESRWARRNGIENMTTFWTPPAPTENPSAEPDAREPQDSEQRLAEVQVVLDTEIRSPVPLTDVEGPAPTARPETEERVVTRSKSKRNDVRKEKASGRRSKEKQSDVGEEVQGSGPPPRKQKGCGKRKSAAAAPPTREKRGKTTAPPIPASRYA